MHIDNTETWMRDNSKNNKTFRIAMEARKIWIGKIFIDVPYCCMTAAPSFSNPFFKTRSCQTIANHDVHREIFFAMLHYAN
jgi:hypothetical protein